MMDFHDMRGVDGNVDLTSLSDEELKELIRVNKDAQAALQDEISTLKKQINQFGIDLVPPKEFRIVARPDGTNNAEIVRAKLEAEIKETSTRLEETVQLTDIIINKVEREVTEIDEQLCKKTFSVDLEILDRKVHLKYDMEESLIEEDEDTSTAKVVWFEVSFDQEINDAIGREIVKAADRTAIHSVFSLLKTFLQWHKTKDQLVQHFLEKYPNNVQAETNSEGLLLLKLSLQEPNHPMFVIEWDRKTVDTRIVPDLRLRVAAPSQMMAMDENKLLDKAPEMFSYMLSSYGQEKAIDDLIGLLIRNQQDRLASSLS